MRHRTTSIKRPTPPAAADEGRSRVGDLSRPIPADKRISRRPQVAALIGLFALFVVVVLGAAVFILPIGTWRDQDEQLDVREQQLEELRRVNGQLAAEVERLVTDEGVREAAGEELGYLELDEERLAILAFPDLPSDLPNGWPYIVTEQILEVRRAESSTASGG